MDQALRFVTMTSTPTLSKDKMDQIPPKEVKILETAKDNQERKEQVLTRYSDFQLERHAKRKKLEDSRRFQYFKRDADELESSIYEKLHAASHESYKGPTNLQAKFQKHQAFEAEVAALSNAIAVLDNTGKEMINHNHFASNIICKRLEELHKLRELLEEEGMKLQQALALLQFLSQCDEVMFWISDKETFVTTDEFGLDLEHCKVLQCKFDEFQKDMASQEYRVTEMNELADKLVLDGHPERDVILKRKEELIEAWMRLKQLALMHQKKLFDARKSLEHCLEQLNRDADETVAWTGEKDVVLSSDDYGRDLATVQTLQRKHEGVEGDLAALKDKLVTLVQEVDRLCGIHASHADQLQAPPPCKSEDELKEEELQLALVLPQSEAEHKEKQDSNTETLKNFVSDFKRTLECAICMDLVKQPFKQCATGHLMCVGCLNTITSCPTCQATLTTENHVCIKQLLQYLPHDCRYSVNGCEQIVQDGNDHEKYCGFRLVECQVPYCTQKISVKMLLDHFKTGHPISFVVKEEKLSLTWSKLNPVESYVAYNLVHLFNCLFWVCIDNNVEEKQVKIDLEAIPISKLDSNYYLNISFENGDFRFGSTLKAYIPEQDEPSDQREDVRRDGTGCMKIPQGMVSHLINKDGDLTAELSFFKR